MQDNFLNQISEEEIRNLEFTNCPTRQRALRKALFTCYLLFSSSIGYYDIYFLAEWCKVMVDLAITHSDVLLIY